jgi:GT2 family glycosyltransferase
MNEKITPFESDGMNAQSSEIGVAALVVTWNRQNDVLDCIKSLTQSDYTCLRVYVVDNGSTDNTSDLVSKYFPSVVLIRSDRNLGFADGNNLGLDRILDDGTDAVFFLNDDAVVAHDTLKKLVPFLCDDGVGIVCPKILVYGADDVIWAAGGIVDSKTGIARQRYYGEKDLGQADEQTDVDYAVGCAMLVKSEVIRNVGKLDSRYYMYYEEAEWCRRIRNNGYRIVYVPTSKVWHKVSIGETGRNNAPYYFSRNRLLYLRAGGVSEIKVAWFATLDILRDAIAHAVNGRIHESRLLVRGILDYYKNNFGRIGDG